MSGLISRYTSTLEHDPAVIYVVDARMQIVYCNAAWDSFALANGGDSLLRPAPIGRDVMAVVPWDLHEFYVLAFEEVRRSGRHWDHRYECSSADVFRRFHMRVSAASPDEASTPLIIVNSLEFEQPHQYPPGLEDLRSYRDRNGIVTMCCHCRRTKRPEALEVWDWVPEFVREGPARVSHGLCAPCFQIHYGRRGQ
jgi:PAS domain-containing protein